MTSGNPVRFNNAIEVSNFSVTLNVYLVHEINPTTQLIDRFSPQLGDADCILLIFPVFIGVDFKVVHAEHEHYDFDLIVFGY